MHNATTTESFPIAADDYLLVDAGNVALRDWDKSILIASGLDFVGRDYVIKPNDEISVMPPVQGG